jgi:uncharacterized RDD family membrane protein YckC
MASHLPDPVSNPELFDGILGRRVGAFLIDMAIISVLVATISVIGGIAGFFTFGLAWMALLLVIPGVVILYYAVTLGSVRRATIGMGMMDLVLTPTGTTPLNGALAFIHAALFWLTIWISWPISLGIVLFTPRRQMIHDLIVGTLMVRRSPMVRHWQEQAVAA